LDLIKNGHVEDWDDPRLYTLIALRRRGVPPGAIISFVNDLGVTKALTSVEVKRFEQTVRKYLETSAPRLMLVLDPVKVLIENLDEGYEEMVELPFSKDPEYGVRILHFTYHTGPSTPANSTIDTYSSLHQNSVHRPRRLPHDPKQRLLPSCTWLYCRTAQSPLPHNLHIIRDGLCYGSRVTHTCSLRETC